MLKKFSFWLVATLVIMLGLYSSVRVIMTMSGLNNAANIKSVVIIPEPIVASQKNIMSVLDIKPNTPIYDLNLSDLSEKVSAIPEIGEAEIKRTPNGKLFILISELIPVAIWTDGENIYPITDDGQVIHKAVAKNKNALCFYGEIPKNISSITGIFAKFPEIMRHIKYVERIENRRFDIYTNAGSIIKLPEGEISVTLRKLNDLQKTSRIMERKLSVIDMRYKSGILVQ